MSACLQLGYYAQTEIGRASAPYLCLGIITELEASDKLKLQLRNVKEIRQFTVGALALPDNGSYRNYAQLQRKFVLWNVFAAPALSLTQKQ